jgi:PKD repeat protein
LSKTYRRSTLAFLATLTLIAVSASAAAAAPTASFTVSEPRQTDTPVTFTSTSTAPDLFAITNTEWDFSYDGMTFDVEGSGASITRTFSLPGSYTVAVRVTSNEPADNQRISFQTITVAQANRPPTALFTFAPTSPVPNEDVLFASNSTDPDGDSLSHSWDFGDGSGPNTQRNPAHAYATPGTKTVRLTVDDGRGGVDDETHTIVVRDPSAARASFDFTPQTPVVNQTVTFTSTSTPSAGQTITSQNWDLDSDGQYDDAQGRTAARAFDSAGVYRVALRVVQANGNAAVAEGTVRVGSILATPTGPGATPGNPSPTVPGGTPPRARPSLLAPFPVVRLLGRAYPHRTVVTVLSVQAPRGALVRVRCRGKGRGCPSVTRRKRSTGKRVRFKTFERTIRPRAKLEVFVLAPGRIGKYARFKMRRGKPPARVDACVMPGKTRPRPCPS